MALLENLFSSLLSSPITGLLAIVLLLLLHLVSAGFRSKASLKEPPGPKPLPLLGNLLQMDLRRPHRSLCEFSKKYGSVFTVHMGPNKVVVLAGYKVVKEALISYAKEFGNRYVLPVFHDMNPQAHGILPANGKRWKETRRFALSTLKDFGMGKRVAEEKILEECGYLIEMFQQHKGKPFDTTHVSYAVSNIICSVIYGSRYDYGDPRLTKMVARSTQLLKLSGSVTAQMYNMFPRMFGWIKNRQVILRNTEDSYRELKDLVKHLKETLNPNSCRGFVDCFLVQQQKEQDAGVTDSVFTEENLLASMFNLFTAGTDTTAATLRWALLLMAKYPRIQDRVQEELNRVIGSRQIRVEDRKELPFTDAVIHETQRLASILPIAVPHKTSQDVTFQGYFIKEGTTVFPLLTSVLHDESEWESPHTFNPAHFLNQEGKFIQRDAFMAFSAGRRVCLGESLARMELFLVITSLLQRFRFTAPPGVSEEDLDLTPAAGFVLAPPDHELCAVSHH